MRAAVFSCLRLLRQLACWAFDLARAKAGSRRAARIAMMAITTSNSINVKPVAGRPFAPRFPTNLVWFISTQEQSLAIADRFWPPNCPQSGGPLSFTRSGPTKTLLDVLLHLKPEEPGRVARKGVSGPSEVAVGIELIGAYTRPVAQCLCHVGGGQNIVGSRVWAVGPTEGQVAASDGDPSEVRLWHHRQNHAQSPVSVQGGGIPGEAGAGRGRRDGKRAAIAGARSEEHTSELQSL